MVKNLQSGLNEYDTHRDIKKTGDHRIRPGILNDFSVVCNLS